MRMTLCLLLMIGLLSDGCSSTRHYIISVDKYDMSANGSRVGLVAGVVRHKDDHSPVAGARILLNSTDTGILTDSAGCYLVSDLPAGKYQLMAYAQLHGAIIIDDVTIEPQKRYWIDFEMPRLEKSMRVVDTKTIYQPGQPLYLLRELHSAGDRGEFGEIRGFTIDAQGHAAVIGAAFLVEETKLGALTDMDGSFHVERVPPGMYALEARMVGYDRTFADSIEVRAGWVTQINFILHPAPLHIEPFDMIGGGRASPRSRP